MKKGEMIELLKECKVQGRTIKAGAKLMVYMETKNSEKENTLFIECAKNGKTKSENNPKNFHGINEKQINFGLENGTLKQI